MLCGKGTWGSVGLCQSYAEFPGGDGELGKAVVGGAAEEDVSRQVLGKVSIEADYRTWTTITVRKIFTMSR